MVRTPSVLSPAWGVALAVSAGVLMLAAAPGWLGGSAAYGLREAFSLVCHQIPERSPHLGGDTWALCHRCTGMMVGLVVGLATGPLVRPTFARAADALGAGRVLLLLGVPMLIDWLLGATGLWINTPLSRFATGALFGLGAGWLLADALLRPGSLPAPSFSTYPASPCPPRPNPS